MQTQELGDLVCFTRDMLILCLKQLWACILGNKLWSLKWENVCSHSQCVWVSCT